MQDKLQNKITPMPMLEATSVHGNKIKVAKEKFRIRVSAYAVIMHESKLLLVNTRTSGKWFFPGGEVEIGETLEDAIKREVKEETGIEVEVGKFLSFKETFFYYDPEDVGFQNYGFYFRCKPISFELSEKFQVEFDETEKPEWVDLSGLKKENFQTPADEIFQLL